MAAPDPAAVERKMYVDMHLGGVDDPTKSLAELKYMGGGGVNAFRSAVASEADNVPDTVPPHPHPEYALANHNHDTIYAPIVHTHAEYELKSTYKQLLVINSPLTLDSAQPVGASLGVMVTSPTTVSGFPVTVGTWVFVKGPTSWLVYQPLPLDITPPPVVSNIQFTAITTNSAHVTWSASVDPESPTPITYYYRYYRTGSPSGAYTSTTALTTDLTGLTTNAGYTFEIYVTSKGGTSANSTASFTTLLPSTTYGPAVLADAPKHFWLMNESSGTVIADTGSTPANATIAGGITLGSPGIGAGAFSALAVGGVSTKASYTGTAPHAGANTFAMEGISAWDNGDPYDVTMISCVNGWFVISMTPATGTGPRKLAFSWTDTGGNPHVVQSAQNIPINTPFHWACIYDNTQQRILINGVISGTPLTVGGGLSGANSGSAAQDIVIRYKGKTAGFATYAGTIPSDARFLAHAQAAGLA